MIIRARNVKCCGINTYLNKYTGYHIIAMQLMESHARNKNPAATEMLHKVKESKLYSSCGDQEEKTGKKDEES